MKKNKILFLTTFGILFTLSACNTNKNEVNDVDNDDSTEIEYNNPGHHNTPHLDDDSLLKNIDSLEIISDTMNTVKY